MPAKYALSHGASPARCGTIPPMAIPLKRFSEPMESRFREARIAALAEINMTTYWVIALLVMLFSGWDWFVDPVNWRRALTSRSLGAAVILSSGLLQRYSRRPLWSPVIAKIRYLAAVLAVSIALAALDRGFLIGVAGLIPVILSGCYIALDRRDLLRLNALPMLAVAVVMFCAGLDRFTIINASIFILLALAITLMAVRVFEASNRRAFALEHQLHMEARTDALTSLLNRRALEETGEVELKRAARAGSTLSVILCDIDHFKPINDQHGHDTGDRVIRAVAEQLRSVVRATDAIGRWGGEEFLAILPDTTEADAVHLAERMRTVIAGAAQPVPAAINITVSLGVADVQAMADAPGQWMRVIKAADDAMYRAKQSGRNQVIAASGISYRDLLQNGQEVAT